MRNIIHVKKKDFEGFKRTMEDVMKRLDVIRRTNKDFEKKNERECIVQIGGLVIAHNILKGDAKYIAMLSSTGEVSGRDQIQTCQEGTRAGFQEDVVATLQSKGDGQTPNSCWVHGVAGVGKSAIFASIANTLEKEGQLGGYFIFKYAKSEEHAQPKEQDETCQVLPALARSLLRAHTPYRKHAVAVLRDDPKILGKPPGQQLSAFFPPGIDVRKPNTSLVFVIDALDACTRATEIAEQLMQMIRNIPWLRVMITSRTNFELRNVFEKESHLLKIFDLNTANDVEGDIYGFNDAWLKRVSHLEDKWTKPEVVQKLTDRAKRSFIWASTVRDLVINASDCNKSLEKILDGPLEELFPALDERFGFALDQIPSDLNFIKKVVIIASIIRNKELTVDGLHRLLQPKLPGSEGLTLAALHTIFDRLGSVLYVDTKESGQVRACHPSLFGLLFSPKRTESFQIDLSAINAELFQRCMLFMNQKLGFNICGLDLMACKFNSHVLQESRGEMLSKIPAALQYSCEYWIAHFISAEKAINIYDRRIQTILERFLCGLESLFWIEVMSLMQKVKVGINALDCFLCIRAVSGVILPKQARSFTHSSLSVLGH